MYLHDLSCCHWGARIPLFSNLQSCGQILKLHTLHIPYTLYLNTDDFNTGRGHVLCGYHQVCLCLGSGPSGKYFYNSEVYTKIIFDLLFFVIIFHPIVKTILLILPKIILVEMDRKSCKTEQ